jgi:Response regulator containing CheY-like receiver domain and AraC-type DNA-binding domain
MFKLLIVDDEPRVTKGLKNVLLQSDLGIASVETALNGFEAIDCLRMDTFDLVLTDIQMSRMSGIELMETIYLEQPHLPVIVISAHEKFDFAKKSLRLGARDYLVKPVEVDELLRIVGKVLREKEERAASLKLSGSAAADGRSAKERRDEWLLELVTEKDLSRSEYESLSAELVGQMQGQYFGVAAVRLDLSRCGFSSRGITLRDRKLLKYAAINIVEESLSDWNGLAFGGFGNSLIGIIRLCDQELSGQRVHAESQHHLIGQMLYMNLKQYMNLESTIGMSTLNGDVLTLPKLMDEANAAAEWRRLHPAQKVFYYEDVLERGNWSIVEWNARIDEYMAELKAGIEEPRLPDPAGIVGRLEAMAGSEELLGSCFGMLVYRLYGMLLEYGADNGAPLHRYDPSAYFRGMGGADKLARLPSYIQETAELARLLSKERDQSLLAQITGYIRAHFRNPALKIQDIAGAVHFSTAYLSYLFKRETGKNVWDYVTEQRIEEAKHLLAATDKKRYEVAYAVGYESPEHFSRMFKRCTGVSPADYRKEERGERSEAQI